MYLYNSGVELAVANMSNMFLAHLAHSKQSEQIRKRSLLSLKCLLTKIYSHNNFGIALEGNYICSI